MSQSANTVTQQAKPDYHHAVALEPKPAPAPREPVQPKRPRSGLRDHLPGDWEARKARLAAWDAANAQTAQAPQPQPPK